MAPTDGELLATFAASRDERAFEELIRRHGPMVIGVAGRLCGSMSDAEDAFQATFMVLARKAAGLRREGSVANWLYAVAARVAKKARSVAAARAAHERRAAEMHKMEPDRKVSWATLRPVLDEELAQLPEKYRAPLVLCYLEGRTNQEAAGLLGWTKGTVSGRLARARDKLRERLVRRGLAFSVAVLAAVITENVGAAAAPAALVASTVRAAALAAAGAAAAGAGAGAASSQAAALAEGAIKAMFVAKVKLAAAVVAAVVTTGIGAGVVAHQVAAAERAKTAAPKSVGASAREPAKSPAPRVWKDGSYIVKFAGEVPCRNLPGAAWKPGELKLPLVVHERSGVERRGVLVTSGVPFPPGFLPDASKLRVVDGAGKAVIGQAAPMVKWWKPAYDDSVQWALVSFLADVPAEGKATYYLTDDGKAAAPASPLKVTQTDQEITIDTGAAVFTVPKTGQALLSKAAVGGADVLGSGGLRGTVLVGDWPERGLKAGDKLVATHEASGVAIEEQGPARVVVCIRGGYARGDMEKLFYEYAARLTFAADDSAVRLVYSLNNTKLDPKLYRGKRYAYVWPLQDVSLTADLRLGDKARAATLGDGKAVSSEVGDGPLLVNQSKLDSFEVSVGGKQRAAGAKNSGAIDVTGGGRGLAVARRYFHSEWPGVLSGSSKELRVGLLPGESNEKFHFKPGQRKSWDLRLRFHGAKAPELKDLAAEQETLFLFRPEPAWMVRAAGITGTWTAGLSLQKAPAKVAVRRTPGKMEAYETRGSAAGPRSGWDIFGATRAWNAGGGHWNEDSAFWRWVVYGDGNEFDTNEVRTLWAADLCPIQFEDPDLAVYGTFIYYARFERIGIPVLTYPGYVNRNREENPDTGHMGMWMWHEYYLLTGDMRAREATCNLGDYGRAYLWRWTHDPRKHGTGPTPGTSGCRKMNPEADPDFRLGRRYVSWPLYCLMQKYQFTGDPELLADARIIAMGFRNSARTSPIGQLVADAASKTGTDAHDKRSHAMEYAAGIQRGVQGTASQQRNCRSSASLVCSNFYNAYIVNALREYYTYTRDVEALDVLVGQADHFCRHILIRDPQGKPAGWSYIFADYWGPYTWEDVQSPDGNVGSACRFSSSGMTVADAVGSLYHPTGRPDVIEVCGAADPAMAHNYENDNKINCLRMALAHPKVDQTPPPAIQDLTAEPLGGGKVKLSWSAPGGDGEKGKAAWYQVKWAPGKIVELTKGWPDMTEPLPATHDEWLARAVAFNAKQRAFWAAFNIPGAPEPSAAGAGESMTVEDIPAGKAHFAIKSWDAATNVSGLSNVAEVDVR